MANNICSNCGTQLKPDAKFCVVCGTPVPANIEPTNTAPAPESTPLSEPVKFENVSPQTNGSAPQPAPAQYQQPQPAYQPAQQNYQAPRQTYQQPSFQQTPPPPPYQQPQAAYSQQQYAPYTPGNPPKKESKYEVMSTGAFLGTLLLMMIPLVGLILTIVWACGGTKKENRRNLSRAMLVVQAIALVLGIICGIIIRNMFVKFFTDLYYYGYDSSYYSSDTSNNNSWFDSYYSYSK